MASSWMPTISRLLVEAGSNPRGRRVRPLLEDTMTIQTTLMWAVSALAFAGCMGDARIGDADGDTHENPNGRDPPEPDAASDGKPRPGGRKWDDAVVTAYTFQDNSACNSIMTSSGRPLVPYVSVAVPFRFIQGVGDGPFKLGDVIFVSFLKGRTMPNGVQHTGWVRIDDFCGDHGDDDYCFQNGEPNVDLYIGDWARSGMTCLASNPQDEGSGSFSGPAGDGQERTEVRFGPPPPGQLITNYGGRAMGDGNCGDCAFGKTVQPPACWHYDPGNTNVEFCSCSNSNGRHGECR